MDSQKIIQNKIIKKKISFIVCGNGLGHFKRVLSVCNEIFKINSKIEINIFCSKKSIDLINKNENFVSNNNIYFNYDYSLLEPMWLEYPSNLFLKWENWIASISKDEKIIKSDVIISDNHISPLIVSPKTIIMGSFLWCYLDYNKNKQLKDLIKIEKELIKKYKPRCICVEDIYMPELNSLDLIKLPWFCNKYPKRKIKFLKKEEYKLLITAGGTKYSLKKMESIFLKLNNFKIFNIRVDSNLSNYLFSKGIKCKQFSYLDSEFNKIDLIIARPGIGIITDSIKFNIPICAVTEKNSEILHNIKILKRLKIGFVLEKTIFDVTNFLNDEDKVNSLISSIENIKTGGHKLAANYIINQISN